MAHQARPHHARLANVAIATMLGLAASAAAASGASASSAPVPDFDTTPSCLPFNGNIFGPWLPLGHATLVPRRLEAFRRAAILRLVDAYES